MPDILFCQNYLNLLYKEIGIKATALHISLLICQKAKIARSSNQCRFVGM
jgi:hypothetical protein